MCIQRSRLEISINIPNGAFYLNFEQFEQIENGLLCEKSVMDQ